MLKIEVKTVETKPKSGESKRTGKPYSFREQTVYAHIEGKAYPVETKVTLDNDATPYPPGIYTLGAASFYIDRFGGLAVSPKLVKA